VLRVGVVQTNVPQDNRMDWSTRQRMVDWLAMRDLTVLAARSETRPDLIVWPEGLVPGWTLDPDSLDHERSRGILWKLQPRTPEEELALKDYPDAVPATRVVDEMLALQRAIDIPMLVGSVAYDNLQILTGPEGVEYDYDRMFNSAFVVQSGRVQDVWYDKVHLTPFGEVMPYISAWPWLEQRLLAVGAQGMAFSLSPGGRGGRCL
jgi:apolipoprotein N-acyltransferase